MKLAGEIGDGVDGGPWLSVPAVWPGFVGGPPVFFRGRPPGGGLLGRGELRTWRRGKKNPRTVRAGGCEHAGEGLAWLLGGPYDGHGGGLGSCCLIAVDVGAEGRGPFRGAFFWYNAVSHHLLPAGFSHPSEGEWKFSQNSHSLIILSFTFALFWPFRPLFGFLVAAFPVSAFLRFARMFCVFTYPFHSASLIYAREIENPNLWRSENAHYWGE